VADNKPCVVLLCSDLMMSSTVSGVAGSCGCSFHKVANVSEVASLTSGQTRVLVLIDLATPGLNPTQLGSELPAELRQSAVAYGPHVHTAKLQAAKDAGIGHVMSRGQFSSQVGQIIGAFASAD
jgi:hypothetical protein